MTTTPRRCIVSVSTHSRYTPALNRLEASLKAHAPGIDTLIYRDCHPPGSPPHSEAPYAFKAHALMEAKRRGYTSLLWLDTSCQAIKSVDPLFSYIEEHGYMIFDNANLGEWSSDASLAAFDVTRDAAMSMKETMACCFGLDLRNPLAAEALDLYFSHSNDGVTFQGAWTNERGQISSDPRAKGHRHDQTVLSLICYKLGMMDWLVSHETFASYVYPGTVLKDSVILTVQGIH